MEINKFRDVLNEVAKSGWIYFKSNNPKVLSQCWHRLPFDVFETDTGLFKKGKLCDDCDTITFSNGFLSVLKYLGIEREHYDYFVIIHEDGLDFFTWGISDFWND